MDVESQAVREMALNKESMKKDIRKYVRMNFKKEIGEATTWELYYAVCMAVKDYIVSQWMETHDQYRSENVKKIFYLSMEFLPGRILGNNLLNIGLFDLVKEVLEELGISIDTIEDQEIDPALGNGGLGRLAACILESLSTLGYPAYGCSIRYEYGMFRQTIVEGHQEEIPDTWLINGYPLEIERPEYTQFVRFGGNVRDEIDPETGRFWSVHENYRLIKAVPYDIPIIGYHNGTVTSLRLWDAQPADQFDLIGTEGIYGNTLSKQVQAGTIYRETQSSESGSQLHL